MQLWRAMLGSFAVTAVAASLAAQTPVLSGLSAPYPALQNTQPIHLAGNSYVGGQVAYGPVGTPLVLSGSNLGNSGEVWFVPYKNGAVDKNATSAQANVTLWTPTSLIFSVPSEAMSGLVFVITNGTSSNGLPFIVMPGVYSGICPVVPISTQLQIETASVPNGTVSQPYSATLNAIGGSNSYHRCHSAGRGDLQFRALQLLRRERDRRQRVRRRRQRDRLQGLGEWDLEF
jgi:hypothetical protein